VASVECFVDLRGEKVMSLGENETQHHLVLDDVGDLELARTAVAVVASHHLPFGLRSHIWKRDLKRVARTIDLAVYARHTTGSTAPLHLSSNDSDICVAAIEWNAEREHLLPVGSVVGYRELLNRVEAADAQ